MSSDPDLQKSFDHFVQDLWRTAKPLGHEKPAREFIELVYKDLTVHGENFQASGIEVLGHTDLVDFFFESK